MYNLLGIKDFLYFVKTTFGIFKVAMLICVICMFFVISCWTCKTSIGTEPIIDPTGTSDEVAGSPEC